MNTQDEGWIKELSRDLAAAGFSPPASVADAGYDPVSPLGIVRQCRSLLAAYQQLRTPKVEVRAEATPTLDPTGQLRRRRRHLMSDGLGQASESATDAPSAADEAPSRRHVPLAARS